MGDQCTRCLALEQEVIRLRKENAVLRRKLRQIREFAERVRDRAGAILSHRSGVPRGKWSFARGADQTAGGVLKRC